jgi:hypothetical protein
MLNCSMFDRLKITERVDNDVWHQLARFVVEPVQLLLRSTINSSVRTTGQSGCQGLIVRPSWACMTSPL